MALRLEARKLNIASIVESSKGIVLSWKAVEGRAPVDVVDLARAHPDLLEIFPTETGGKEAPLLRILFKWDFAGDVISQTAEFLRTASKYVILKKL